MVGEKVEKEGKSRKAACQGSGGKALPGRLCVKLGRAEGGQPAGARKGCASTPSGGSQGLQDGDLLAELCSKPRHPGPADGSKRGLGAAEAAACPWRELYRFPGDSVRMGVSESPRLTAAAQAGWFGEGPRAEHPESSHPGSLAPGPYLPAGGGLFWAPLCAGPQDRVLHPVWDLLGPGPPWREGPC